MEWQHLVIALALRFSVFADGLTEMGPGGCQVRLAFSNLLLFHLWQDYVPTDVVSSPTSPVLCEEAAWPQDTW